MDEVLFFSISKMVILIIIKEVARLLGNALGVKQRATVVLCVTSNGLMLNPYIIFKGKANDEEGAEKIGKCFITSNSSAWMTEKLMIDWLKKVYFAQVIPSRTRSGLLVCPFEANSNQVHRGEKCWLRFHSRWFNIPSPATRCELEQAIER